MNEEFETVIDKKAVLIFILYIWIIGITVQMIQISQGKNYFEDIYNLTKKDTNDSY